jgi:hypothetical protein
VRFKTCSNCGHLWNTRADFLGDPEVVAIGYQANFEWLKSGFFLFNHSRKDCRTTVSIEAQVFFDLFEGPLFEKRSVAPAACPGYCLHKDELRACPTHCECSFVRDILQMIVGWSKRGVAI